MKIYQATGTGIWAINFAKKYPQAQVLGTDLSFIQPAAADTPPNCKFLRDDMEDPWIFDRVFDFVHLRLVFHSFDDPKGVLQRIHDNLKPGGWVEYQDIAIELVGSDPIAQAYIQASVVWRWNELIKAGLRTALGRDHGVTLKLHDWMRDTGFVDVVERQVLWPINSWPSDPEDRRLGQFTRLDTEKLLESSVKLLLAGGLTQEELPDFQAEVKWSFGDPNLRGYWRGESRGLLRSLLSNPRHIEAHVY